jgi:hypothetical protein
MSSEPPIVVLHNKYLAALHNDVKSCPRHLSNLRKLAIIGMPSTPVVKKQVSISFLFQSVFTLALRGLSYEMFARSEHYS